MGFQRATLPLGPVFNIGLSAIPSWSVGSLKLTKLNMTGKGGWMIAQQMDGQAVLYCVSPTFHD